MPLYYFITICGRNIVSISTTMDEINIPSLLFTGRGVVVNKLTLP